MCFCLRFFVPIRLHQTTHFPSFGVFCLAVFEPLLENETYESIQNHSVVKPGEPCRPIYIYYTVLRAQTQYHLPIMRLEAKGKTLKGSDTLESLKVRVEGKLFLEDLRPKIGWKTVVSDGYIGPLIYLLP